MNLYTSIYKLLLKYGNEDDKYRLAIPNVYVNYGCTDINLYIDDGNLMIQFPLGYIYKLKQLTNLELFSILYNIQKFFDLC